VLWLALHLPHLPLEICSRGAPAPDPAPDAAITPLVVAEGHGREQWVYAANVEAARLGVHAGMRVSAAYAMTQALRVHTRDPQAEQDALESLAAWSSQYTSCVSLVPPATLLLEVGGSERLYKGLEVLREVVRQGLAELGYSAQLALAPTPLGAVWLARAGKEAWLTDHAALFGALAELPPACLGLEPKREALLTGMGLTRLVDCLRLPRDGLARRLGPELLIALDRAFGRLPDPREAYVVPPRFRSRLGLPAPVADAQVLLFPLRRLVVELCGFLLARGAGATRLQFTLRSAKSVTTEWALSLGSASRALAPIVPLLRDRLERLNLPAPVEEVTLAVDDLIALDAQPLDFFQAQAPAQVRAQMVERLQARLGRAAVRGVTTHADHRPEYAWRYVEAGSAIEAMALERRPLWLLPEPLAIEWRDGRLHWNHPLKLEPERERIESGWWDDREIARDYFVARDGDGRGFWVYRDLQELGQWYVQGIFS
jgi:protein ImuB